MSSSIATHSIKIKNALTMLLIIIAAISFALHPQPARYTSPKFVAASYRVVEREAPRTVLVNFRDGVTVALALEV